MARDNERESKETVMSQSLMRMIEFRIIVDLIVTKSMSEDH